MPFNVRRSSQFFDKEVLKYAQSLDSFPTKSVVIDATSITMSTDPNVRTVVPAGTILTKSADGKKMVAFSGSGLIEGILGRPVDILANVTAGNEPAPMFYHGVVFATSSIVGFTTYAAALVSTLPTCKFE